MRSRLLVTEIGEEGKNGFGKEGRQLDQKEFQGRSQGEQTVLDLQESSVGSL